MNVGPVLHADSADISSTDIFNRGGKPRFGTTGSGGSVLRQCGIFLLLALLSLVVSAVEIPKASGKALGITKGKPFSSGYVFVNGRYIEPPYVIERWGVGIRINSIPVIGSVIDWSEFVKTQSGVKVTKSETPVAAESAPEPEPEPEVEEEDDESDSLDDLFDDDPKPKKAKKPAKRKTVRRAPAKPVATLSYSFEGDFVENEASKKLLASVNKVRTEINVALIKGGFLCFGDGYSRVTGDSRMAENFVRRLSEIQKRNTDLDAFIAAVRAANLVYLTEPLSADLFRNRRDYLRLQQRLEKDKKDREWKQLLNGLDGTSPY